MSNQIETQPQLSDFLEHLTEQEDRTNIIEVKNRRVTEENDKLRKEIEELRSHLNNHWDEVENLYMRLPARREQFPDLNDWPMRIIPTKKDYQIGPKQTKGEGRLALSLLNKISSLEAKINVNWSQYRGMTKGIIRSPFSPIIFSVIAPE